MTDSTNVEFRAYVSPEDQGRANFYALLSRLFAEAPDAALLRAIASAQPLPTEDVGAPLAQAWSKVIAVASAADADAMQEEFEALFIGIGKAPLNLHASHHLTGFMMEQPLADVRAANAALGLVASEQTRLVDDHLASLLETMRVLITGFEGFSPKSLSVQQKYFEKHVAPWYSRCLGQIVKSPLANLYVPVAEFGSEFLKLELEQFALTY
jgi:TorA maturation chaperone TorD